MNKSLYGTLDFISKRVVSEMEAKVEKKWLAEVVAAADMYEDMIVKEYPVPFDPSLFVDKQIQAVVFRHFKGKY